MNWKTRGFSIAGGRDESRHDSGGVKLHRQPQTDDQYPGSSLREEVVEHQRPFDQAHILIDSASCDHGRVRTRGTHSGNK